MNTSLTVPVGTDHEIVTEDFVGRTAWQRERMIEVSKLPDLDFFLANAANGSPGYFGQVTIRYYTKDGVIHGERLGANRIICHTADGIEIL